MQKESTVNLGNVSLPHLARRGRILGTIVCVSGCVWGCGASKSEMRAVAHAARTVGAVRRGATSSASIRVRDAVAARGVRRTRVVSVRPTTSDGGLDAGYIVARTTTGVCEPDSRLVAGETYACNVGEQIKDPCWPALGGRAVYCMSHPWLRTVAEVKVSKPLVPQGESEHAVLWGLELASGLRCEAHRGAGERYRKTLVTYRCGTTLALLGGPVRTSGLWRIREIEYSRRSKSYIIKHEVRITVAWYGASHGESAFQG
jgi:hypothetical protein